MCKAKVRHGFMLGAVKGSGGGYWLIEATHDAWKVNKGHSRAPQHHFTFTCSGYQIFIFYAKAKLLR